MKLFIVAKILRTSYLTFTCSKSTIETLKKGVKKSSNLTPFSRVSIDFEQVKNSGDYVFDIIHASANLQLSGVEPAQSLGSVFIEQSYTFLLFYH